MRPPLGPSDHEKIQAHLLDLTMLQRATLFDRSPCISEGIYRPICRGQDLHNRWWYLSSLMRMNPLVIYCRPSIGKITNFGSRPQMDGVIKNAPLLIKSYDILFSLLFNQQAVLGGTVVRYDWEEDSYHKLRALAFEHSQKFREHLNLIKRLTAGGK